MPVAAIPTLDELAGAWMPVGTLLNMPSVNNFHGALHAANLLSFLELDLVALVRAGAEVKNGALAERPEKVAA